MQSIESRHGRTEKATDGRRIREGNGAGGPSEAWSAKSSNSRQTQRTDSRPLTREGEAADAFVIVSGAPGRIVEALRCGGVRNPVFLLDGIDGLDKEGAVAAALREAIAPLPGAAFRDRYVDLDFDLSEALFVATANSLGPVPAVLREGTEAEKRAIAAGHLLPFQLKSYRLTALAVVAPGIVGEALRSAACCFARG